MSPRNTILLALVVAIAGGLVWWFEVRGADERAAAEDAERRVFRDVAAEDVAWIELRTRDGARARLERTAEGSWGLVDPLRFPADAMAADGLASALTELVSERVFDEHEPLEVYGLEDEPEVRFGTDATSFALRLGDKTPVGGNTYVAREDGDPVYAVATWRTSALQKDLGELRESRVLDFDREAVTGLEARWPGGSVRLERGDGDWRLVEPADADADADAGAVEGLLADLAFLRADDFVDEPPPDAELGLDDPAYRVTLQRGEDADPVELVVGGSDGTTRAVRGRDGAVFRVAAARLEDLPRSVDAWRFKELARFDVPAARRFEIVFHPAGGGEPVQIEGVREDGGFRTQPHPMAPGKAAALLTALSGLDAQAVAADAMGEQELAALGLAPPRARIRVRGEAPGEGDAAAPMLADVALGVVRDGRLAARRAGRDEVFWLDADVAEHVPVSLDAWHNRFAAPETEQDDAAGEGPAAEEPAPDPDAGAPEGALGD